jgi:polysaccharide biosynthesis protein PslH
MFMNILIISSAVPYPLIDGGKKGVFFPIKELAARGHSIHLLSLTKKRDEEALRAVAQYCTVEVVVQPKTVTVSGALRSLFSATPFDMSRYQNKELLDLVRKTIRNGRFDVVQVEGAHEAWYGVKIKEEFGLPVAIRVHSLQHMNILRLVGTYRNPLLNLFLWFDGIKMSRYESREGKKLDVNMVVSDVDGDILRRLDPDIFCMTVPAGVDLGEFVPGEPNPEPKSVLWMGSLGWPPNQDSFWWFYRKIVPKLVERVPDVRIRVVGSSAPDEILQVKHPNVSMLGFVPDVREVLNTSQVCVVPLQAGSGIRIKLMEMFAMKKAVVSTTIGAEGLNVENGKHLMLADTPEDFAAAVARLLADPALRTRLGEQASMHVREHYGWDRLALKYEEAHKKAIERSSAR